ncbi:MAG TPA: glycine oxidase ThiO [Pyrinomonadaceae bacterium]|nr:glycine oxidase ThiO [Pyrinomonadaceae bacterium]
MAYSKGSADVVIIGGGVIGLAIARGLALRGVRNVCLVERATLGTEASFAAAGMLLPQVEADAEDDFFKLACRSRDLYPSFAAALREETGVDIELDTTGTLYLALNEHDHVEIEKRHGWQTHAGLAVELLSAAAVREIEPCISESVFGALRFPNDIQVENRRLLSALANSVTSLGVKVLTETNVESLEIERDRVAGVQTNRGTIACKSIVIAAGTWSSFLLRSSVLPDPAIQPVRGQMICLESKPQLTRHVLYSPRGYLVPRQDGRLLAGSTSENAGFAKRITAGGINSILQNTLEISPAIATLPIVDTWAGLRPRPADGLPVLGACGEIDGVLYATGHYRNGILLAPLTAELITEAVVTGVTSPLLAPFSPDRFSSQPVLR